METRDRDFWTGEAEQQAERYEFSIPMLIGITLLVFIVFQLILPLIILPFFYQEDVPIISILTSSNFLLVATLLWQVVSTLFLLRFLQVKGFDLVEYFRLKQLQGKDYLVLIVTFVLVAVVVELVTHWLSLPPNQMMEGLIRGGHPALVIVVLAIFAPVFEELFFRGFLYNELVRKYSPAVAIAVPAVFFALVHLQYGWVEISLVAFIALVLGYLRYKYDNLNIVIGVHFLNNLASYLFFQYVY